MRGEAEFMTSANEGAGEDITTARWGGPRLVEPLRSNGAGGDAAAGIEFVSNARVAPVSRSRSAALTGRNLDRIVGRVARSRVSVLITGETGVGKDAVARRIHAASPRAGGPFVAVNCAAFSETLLDSELFGHERGAFTGAEKTRAGIFELAAEGTLFLDEVGELSPAAQAKLLRVLETRSVHRVGGLTKRDVDIRVVSATNRDLPREVAAGHFRADLLFRLEVVRLTLPPLRERPWEIVPAARKFLEEHAQREDVPPLAFTKEAEVALAERPWEGNFRELRNTIERAAFFCEEGLIRVEDLDFGGQVTPPDGLIAGDASTAEGVIAALSACAGNQTRAAELLGISRRTLITRLETFGIRRPQVGTWKRRARPERAAAL
jgi:DNA-binding NtrC family response regulator